MLLLDRLQTTTKEQLIAHIKSYEQQIVHQKEMSKHARLDHLFGSSKQEDLKIAKEELARRM